MVPRSLARLATLGLVVFVSSTLFLAHADTDIPSTPEPTGRAGSDPAGDLSIAAVMAEATQLGTGDWHTCALTASGGVKCWGANFYGQLGDGTWTTRSSPVDVYGLTTGVIGLAAGRFHTCAITGDGGLQCWGWNQYGQLGDGSANTKITPVSVSGLASGVTEVSAGFDHTCAVLAGGALRCWGSNGYGQLGDGTTTAHNTPAPVTGLGSGVAAVDAGFERTCALKSGAGGSLGVKCWGWNYGGAVGDGTTTNRTAPVDVVGLASGAAAVTTGGWWHSCALMQSGAVKCWGTNSRGQIGVGTPVERYTPVDVPGVSGATSVATGLYHTCATVGGAVKCWGDNWAGQLGDGTAVLRPAPVQVSGLTEGARIVAAGESHNCALMAGGYGGIKCWGLNTYGQLGNGSTSAILAPTDAAGLVSGVSGVTAGESHTCALTGGTSPGVQCWGRNSEGQLGDGTSNGRYTPAFVSGLASGAAKVAAGHEHTCAVVAGGAKCWGWNGSGQLGDGTMIARQTPVEVLGLGSGVQDVAAAAYHSCALTDAAEGAGGGVKCWGDNDGGQLGDGTTQASPVRVSVSGLESGAAGIATGGVFSCALTSAGGTSGGGVKCWGYNYYGQLGDGTTTNRSLPVDVVGLSSGVVAITTGRYHACALNQAGGVLCWGYNGAYQLGNGGAPTAITTPVQAQGLTSGVAGIAAGGSHTCAVLTDGRVKCWGSNSSGQIGDGTMTTRPTPVTVLGLIDAIAVAAGGSHTCAVTAGGALKCWGGNDAGQAGILPLGWTPVDVAGFTSVAVTPTPSPTPADTPICGATATPQPPFTGTLPAAGSLSRQIANCNDDTYVRIDTEELLYAAEFVRMGARADGAIPYTAGFLFRNVRVPRGARITSAHLTLQPELHQSGTPVTVSIAGEAHGQSGDFSPRNWWAHLRPRTIARVPWTVSTLVTEATQSPDISAIIEEIVALPDWAPGNNLAILIDNAEGGQQFVNWKAFELDAGHSAALALSYDQPAPTPTPKPVEMPALRALTPPTLDGEVAEWQGVASTPLNLDAAATISGDIPTLADLSAQLRSAWSPSMLYFAAYINDDVLVGNNSSQIWGDDAIELGIRVGQTTHQFTLAVDGRQADAGNPITSLTVATRTVPGGWSLEVGIPAAALGLAQFAAAQTYPFTFGLWDDDLFTYPGQTHLIWRGTSTNTYGPDWGLLTLSDVGYSFPAATTSRIWLPVILRPK